MFFFFFAFLGYETYCSDNKRRAILLLIADKLSINNNNNTLIEKDHLGDWSPEKDCC